MRGLSFPPQSEDFTADPVELFFDLAFVFAFSRLVWLLVHHPTWGGAAEAGLLFTIMWFGWSVFTWAANAVSGNGREVRAIFLVATATSVPMAASVTSAFEGGGRTFAICAGLIVLMAIALQLWTMGTNEEATEEFRSVLRFTAPNILAVVALMAGGFVTGNARPVLWVLFIAITIASIIAARSGDWIVRPGHFAERHGLIIIIALGEIVVAIGISVVNSLSETDGLPGQTLFALTAAGALAGLLWWGYFDRVQPAMEHRGEELTGRQRAHFVADVYTGFHVFIVGGIIATAAAAEEILLHPKDPVHSEFLIMFVAGIGLFFGGIALSAYRAYKVIAKERLAAVVAIGIAALLAGDLDGAIFLVIVDVILLVSILVEHMRIEHPHAPAEADSAMESA